VPAEKKAGARSSWASFLFVLAILSLEAQPKKANFLRSENEQQAQQPYRTGPWGPVARLYTPRNFKQPTKPTLKVRVAGQNFSDFTLTSKMFPDIVYHLKNVAVNT
jgi:hypothetical protein